MKRLHDSLRVLGWWCFGVFLLCAIVAAITGVLLIWQSDSDQMIDDVLWRVFLMTLLLTIISGLVVSGVRSMSDLATDREGG